MPRYFFDTDDGEHRQRDDVGMDLIDMKAVSVEAFGLLHDLVLHHLPDGERRMTVTVRDMANVPVYRGEMLVKGRRFL